MKIKILVAIDNEGKWAAAGYFSWSEAETKDCIFIDDLGTHLSYFWVEAEIPVPTIASVEGVATETDGP